AGDRGHRAMRSRLALFTGLTLGAASGGPAMAESFASRAQAMAYIADALPKASRANPDYVTKSDGTVSRWLTDDVRFTSQSGGAVEIEMRESYTQTKDGKTSPGRHEAKFSLAD